MKVFCKLVLVLCFLFFISNCYATESTEINVQEWSGNQVGGSLTTDVILVGDTYMTSIITIGENVVVTIDLNGYMLKGSGNGSIINNKGVLTIKDSRPTNGSHKFKKTTTGPWVLDENGEEEIVGGIITGGKDLTAATAGSSGGGAIKQNSNNINNVLFLEGGTLVGNSSTRAGGAIYGGAVTMNGGRVVGNYASLFGGGVSVSGSFTLNGGVIEQNETDLSSKHNKKTSAAFYDNASVIIGQKSSFTMNGGTLIGNMSTVTSSSGTPKFIFTNGYVKGNFRILNGLKANISGGTLNGSIYMKKGSCTVSDSALIHGGVNENGGAVYIEGGDFEMLGGVIKNSSAKNGGAINITNGNFIMNGGSIEECVASEKGGAIYLADGNFTMSGGNIGRIQNNKKLGCKAVYGGAVYVVGGNFTMNGGTIEGNTATNSGGAIEISDGNVYITDGKISSNVARGEESDGLSDVGYGGGIFVDGGDIVSITGGEISNNVAAKNGGGIEIKTDKVVTVDVYSGSFYNNVADECGGAFGIECVSGIINVGKENCDGATNSSHMHPVLSGNLAGIQGGGFYMTGKDAVLNIYCGIVDNNIVVDVENNFDQSSGTVTVHEGVSIGNSNEGIIVVGGTFVDKRTKDEDAFKVVYYSNFEGSTDYKEALITNGSTITLPGNIFGVEGYAIVGWVTDKNNTTMIEYEVGAIVEITEEMTIYALWVLEEKNEPSYIVVIPEIISFGNDSIISFDIGVTLELFPRDKALVIRASEENLNLKLYSDGIEIDSTPYKIVKDDMEIGSGGVIASFYSDSSLITYNSVETIGIKVTGTQKYVGDYKGNLTFIISIEDV